MGKQWKQWQTLLFLASKLFLAELNGTQLLKNFLFCIGVQPISKQCCDSFRCTAKDSVQFSSVPQSCPTLCDPIDCSTPGLPVHHQHPESTHSNLFNQWCHPTISSPIVPFSSDLQSFPASESFQMSQFFTSGGQSIGVSASATVFPVNTQDWFPLGWTGWISLQSKGLSRVFSNTTVQKHQLFGAQLSL